MSDSVPDGGDEIAFLTIEEVKLLHEESIRRYSPAESLDIRDLGLLESAVMAPQATWGGQFLHQSLAAMAASYLVSLNQNHAFVNGNKRVAFAACSTFLRLNGFRLTVTQDEAVELTLIIARHDIDLETVASMLENAIEPV